MWNMNSKCESRALCILYALMGLAPFTKDKTILEQVHALDKYRKASGLEVSDDILLTTLVKSLPKQLQQHIQLNLTESSIFGEIKDRSIAYERVNTTWSRDRVYNELGAVTSYSTDGG